VEYKAKANFRVLGKQLGKDMKAAAGQIAQLTSEQIAEILGGGKLVFDVAGRSVELDNENVIVDRIEKDDLKVINDGTLTVGLDTKITDSLSKEGYARDLVRGIQNLRKESGFELTDRITLEVSGDAKLKAAFGQFKDYIASETLAASADWKDSLDGAVQIESDELAWQVKVARV
ncbi:MAG: isoleucine--tRNA ligase, partial [Treponema sp.]|nr:isoleucine--tRNA ligase [Treponema sp.]